ncbi:PspA/IM30 family protein [Calothrix sp. PCC 6303]|uniref:PspA/IM30 family protein n=1 Tax=Calothrix sp. PCC 6303 TaxID=1170562 RepID=UPI0002A032CA|nr:PspA/IM30 family protein [Calothrix sp. PCC 6303]AFZ02922.1 PspA/IM30 family protein [Calothrix sp. PCC 6303]
MKKAVYWLMGEKAGRTIIATWNWLWGIPIESGGKVAVAVAEDSLQSMQQAVHRLATAVATQEAAYKNAKTKYEAKARELKSLENKAIAAQNRGDEEDAKLAMMMAIQTEQILPRLEEMVLQAERAVGASKDKLNRERLKLETYKAEMQNMRDISEVNAALEEIAKVNNEFDIGSAKNDFEKAKDAVERRNFTAQALAELSENSGDKLQADIENMALNDEVSRRLEKLKNFPSD